MVHCSGNKKNQDFGWRGLSILILMFEIAFMIHDKNTVSTQISATPLFIGF